MEKLVKSPIDSKKFDTVMKRSIQYTNIKEFQNEQRRQYHTLTVRKQITVQAACTEQQGTKKDPKKTHGNSRL